MMNRTMKNNNNFREIDFPFVNLPPVFTQVSGNYYGYRMGGIWSLDSKSFGMRFVLTRESMGIGSPYNISRFMLNDSNFNADFNTELSHFSSFAW